MRRLCNMGHDKPKRVAKPNALLHTMGEKSKGQQGDPAHPSQRPEQAPIQGSRGTKTMQEACQENSKQANCRHVQRVWKRWHLSPYFATASGKQVVVHPVADRCSMEPHQVLAPGRLPKQRFTGGGLTWLRVAPGPLALRKLVCLPRPR